jgi:hypothetical protein
VTNTTAGPIPEELKRRITCERLEIYDKLPYNTNGKPIRAIDWLPQMHSEAPSGGQNYFRSYFEGIKSHNTCEILEIDENCHRHTNRKLMSGYRLAISDLLRSSP